MVLPQTLENANAQANANAKKASVINHFRTFSTYSI